MPVVSLMQPPDPTPLLQPDYRAFVAHTSRSAPVLRFGISPRGFGRLSFSLNIGATGSRSSVQPPASASRPLYAGRHPLNNQAPNGFVPEKNYAPGFDDIRMRNDASSKGSLSFVSRMHTCASYPRAFPPTHTTTAFDRSSLEVV